jgi:hypothetical protein
MQPTTISPLSSAARLTAITALLLVSAPAQAGSFETGIAGAQVEGVSSRDNGQSRIRGSLTDTRCDKQGAVLDIDFGAADRGFLVNRGQRVEAAGCGKATRFDFSSRLRPVRITVCAYAGFRLFDCSREKTVID